MARYIDADKLKERLKIISDVADDLYEMGINRGLDRAETEIDMLPTADVVEVDKVAEMFAEQFGDKCPCNFNDNDEWLPYVCEHTNTCDCPCKEGWKQFVKHYAEKKAIMNGGNEE